MTGVAVVGLGWWGQQIIGKLASGGIDLEVVATVDPAPAAGATLPDLDAALADPAVEAVVLCTPHSQHAAQIVRSAEAGRHVFCEKPLTLDAASASQAVAACQAAGLVLGVGHERRFEDSMREVRRLVTEGELGTILHAEAALSHDKFTTLPADHWRGSEAEAPAAGMTGMGVHLTDGLISLLGPVATVWARSARRVLALPSGDVVVVSLVFRSGATATVSAVSATPFYGRFAVFGSAGWVEVVDDEHPEAGSAGRLTVCRQGERPVTTAHPAGDAVSANLRAFADAIHGRAPYPIGPAELVHNVAVLEAVVRSTRTHEPVEMVGELAWPDDAIATHTG